MFVSRKLFQVALVIALVIGWGCSPDRQIASKEELAAATDTHAPKNEKAAVEPGPVEPERLRILRAVADGSLNAEELFDPDQGVVWVMMVVTEVEEPPPPDELMQELGLDPIERDHGLVCAADFSNFAQRFAQLIRDKLSETPPEWLEEACVVHCNFGPAWSQDGDLRVIFDDDGHIVEVIFSGFNGAHTMDPDGSLRTGIGQWVATRRAELKAQTCP